MPGDDYDDDDEDDDDDNANDDYDDDLDFENQAWLLLQVEREGFPCSCGPQCANPEGRREFDETEVGQWASDDLKFIRF